MGQNMIYDRIHSGETFSNENVTKYIARGQTLRLHHGTIVFYFYCSLKNTQICGIGILCFL